MLSVEEVLLFKAVQDEQERQEAQQAAAALGGLGGAALGVAGGTIPHKIGNALNSLRPAKTRTLGRALRPGFRAAGGLTGAILGGGLGAGMAAMMKGGSEAGDLLGKIQAQKGTLDALDEARLAQLLGEIYSNPSQLR